MAYSSPMKYVLIGKESAWGTGVTADKNVGLVMDVSDSGTREVTESMSMSSISAQAIKTHSRDDKLSMSLEYQHGRVLEYAFGTVAHDETTGDWKHTFTVSNNPPSATIETGNDLTTNTVLTHTGMMVEALEINTALDQNVELKVDWSGKTFTTGTTSTAAVISSISPLAQPDVNVTLGGETPLEVQELNIKVVKKVDKAHGLGSELAQSGKATELKYEWSAKLGFDSKVYHDMFADNTPLTLILDAHNGVTLGSGRIELKITLDNCSIKAFDETATVGNLTFIDISGVGLLNEIFTVDNIADTAW